MLRRVIAFVLTLSILGYGIAWAFDGHPVDLADHDHATEHPDSGPPGDEADCDHCCHASAHLIGMPRTTPVAPPRAVDRHLPVTASVPAKSASDQPLKPPRS